MMFYLGLVIGFSVAFMLFAVLSSSDESVPVTQMAKTHRL